MGQARDAKSGLHDLQAAAFLQQKVGGRDAQPVEFQLAMAAMLLGPHDRDAAQDTPARIVVDQRTGTVVIGKNVQISTVAITHGALTIRVTETPEVSQPDPFSMGQTVVVPRTQITAAEERVPLAIVRGADLQTLVKGLNQMGLKPSDVIAILQAVKTAGALQAELVIQ